MKNRLDFTKDFVTRNIKNWKNFLSIFAKRSHLEFLEIGVFEGRTTVWLHQNILTHKTSKITCIDTFQWTDTTETRFDKNTAAFKEKVIKIKGISQEELRKLPIDYYDFIYIDASHKAPDVLEDAILAFRLLKTNGIMIFDDYRWRKSFDVRKRPKMGIDIFLNINKGKYELLLKDYQVIIKKGQPFERDAKLFDMVKEFSVRVNELPDDLLIFIGSLGRLLFRLYTYTYTKGWMFVFSFPKNVICPCCGWQGIKFITYRKRKNAICPNCQSRERHRFLYTLLQKFFAQNRLGKNPRILYVAPEPLNIENLFKGKAKNRYLDIVMRPTYIMQAIDLTNLIGFEDDYFDFVFICYFLEHIKNERDILEEIKRTLKTRSGVAILSVPIDSRNKNTVEFTDREAQSDPNRHVRKYGMDFFNTLRAIGFNVEIASSFLFPEKARQKYAFGTEWAAICRKT